MKKTLLFIISVLVLHTGIYACGGLLTWVYAGDISYSLDSTNPLYCSVIVSLEFDIPDNLSTDTILMNWGDGTISPIHATSIIADSVANYNTGANVYYKHVYAGKHLYAALPDSGFYIISPVNQFRQNGISNVDDGANASTPFYIEALVNVDSSGSSDNRSPDFVHNLLMAFAPISTSFSEDQNFVNENAEDSVVFDFATPLMDHDLTVDSYYYPDYFCSEFGYSVLFTINHHTGEITWLSPCEQGIFNIAEVVSTYRHGYLLGSTMRDQMIYVGSGILNNIPVVSNQDIQLFPNPASDQLNGTFTSTGTKPVSLKIISTEGNMLTNNIQVKGYNFNVDISSLASGLYFLQLNNGTQTIVKKFVKQ